jgi:hypothetical protein
VVRAVKILKGEPWRYQNDACGAEILVLVSSEREDENRRCFCGSIMKKRHDKR